MQETIPCSICIKKSHRRKLFLFFAIGHQNQSILGCCDETHLSLRRHFSYQERGGFMPFLRGEMVEADRETIRSD